MILRLLNSFYLELVDWPLTAMPLDVNPYADWSCRQFTDDRTQYILLSNTKSLYSCLMCDEEIKDKDLFYDRALRSIREFTARDDQRIAYQKGIAPACRSVSFAKSLSPSVTRSTGLMIRQAQAWLIEEEISPFDAGVRLNAIPKTVLGDTTPRDAFQAMRIQEHDGQT